MDIFFNLENLLFKRPNPEQRGEEHHGDAQPEMVSADGFALAIGLATRNHCADQVFSMEEATDDDTGYMD